MRRETQNLLLLLLGGALLKISFNGTYLHYVKPSLLPWLVASGAGMVLLAGYAILLDIRSAQANVEHGSSDVGESCGVHKGHDDEGSRSPWMLLLPVFAIFLVAPPALGADSVGRAGEQAAAPQQPQESLFGGLPPGNAPPLNLSEFVTRAVWDTSGALDHRAVRLRGFVVHPDGPGPVQIARMRISCCAADASPIKVGLVGSAARQAALLPADSWIEVTGTLRPGTATEANDHVPAFAATEIHGVPAPPNPYEY